MEPTPSDDSASWATCDDGAQQSPSSDELEANSVAAISGRAPASELYRDLLYHLFGFLTLSEFASAARTHHAWMSSAVSMSSRKDCVYLGRADLLSSLVSSPLRHHVTVLDCPSEEEEADEFLSPERITAMGREMVHLAALTTGIQVSEGMGEARFPPDLTSLHLTFTCPEKITPAALSAICTTLSQSIAQLSWLASLEVHRLDEAADDSPAEASATIPAEMFQALVALPAITSLDCSPLSLEAIDTIRCMTHLRRLDCEAFSIDHLKRLVTGDAPIPPLESLPSSLVADESGSVLHGDMVPSLVRLTTLTRLEGKFDLPDVGPLLGGLLRLRDLRLTCLRGTKVDPDCLVNALQACPQLTALHLAHPRVTSAHCDACLPWLPSLHSLELECGRLVTDLSFLRRLPSLTKLELHGRNKLDLLEAGHLEKIPRLQLLELYRVFREPFDRFSLATRRPEDTVHFHAQLWPHLKSFAYDHANKTAGYRCFQLDW